MVLVHLKSYQPLATMIRSIEQFRRRESIGELYGYVEERNGIKDYFLTSVQPYENLDERLPTFVEVNSNAEENLANFTTALESSIGYYHSHIIYWNNKGFQKATPHPSETDLEYLKENPDKMMLILARNESKRVQPLRVYPNRILGTLLDKKYNIMIYGYYLEKNSAKNKGRIERVRFKVPIEEISRLFYC